jgi:ATP synthase protein I
MSEDGIGSKVVPRKDAITGGWSSGVDLISSIVAGLLIGLGLDWLFGTQPVFVIIVGLAGFGSGAMKLWKYSEILEHQAEARRRGR